MSLHNYLRPRAKGPSADGSWAIRDLCTAYQWPASLTGGGVIAIVELGGGWLPSDVKQFCSLNNIPLPNITDVSVGGVTNNPGVDPDSDGEVALDIQVSAASYSIATGLPAIIRVYWANDIAPAIRAALEEGCDVCSISWGQDEAQWDEHALVDLQLAILEAAQGGMVVFAASGDNDSSDGGPNPANVDAPASCPSSIACGGTSRTLTSETVWNNDPGDASGSGTGGGFSTVFTPVPKWQIGAPHGPGRMVPDVSANADPETGYQVIIAGQEEVVGGTSAVAPLYAGLFASFGRHLGTIGPSLWLNALAFTDITQGDNGLFRAGPGPDPCTGLGSPIGVRLAKQFIAVPVAAPVPVPVPPPPPIAPPFQPPVFVPPPVAPPVPIPPVPPGPTSPASAARILLAEAMTSLEELQAILP